MQQFKASTHRSWKTPKGTFTGNWWGRGAFVTHSYPFCSESLSNLVTQEHFSSLWATSFFQGLALPLTFWLHPLQPLCLLGLQPLCFQGTRKKKKRLWFYDVANLWYNKDKICNTTRRRSKLNSNPFIITLSRACFCQQKDWTLLQKQHILINYSCTHSSRYQKNILFLYPLRVCECICTDTETGIQQHFCCSPTDGAINLCAWTRGFPSGRGTSNCSSASWA